LKAANLEPKFSLVISGEKNNYIMQLAEFFVVNLNPEKGLYNDQNSIIYTYENPNITFNKLNMIKDIAVIVDGIIKPCNKSFENLYSKPLRNYYWNSNTTNKIVRECVLILCLFL
jgi:hypothetical protein